MIFFNYEYRVLSCQQRAVLGSREQLFSLTFILLLELKEAIILANLYL